MVRLRLRKKNDMMFLLFKSVTLRFKRYKMLRYVLWDRIPWAKRENNITYYLIYYRNYYLNYHHTIFIVKKKRLTLRQLRQLRRRRLRRHCTPFAESALKHDFKILEKLEKRYNASVNRAYDELSVVHSEAMLFSEELDELYIRHFGSQFVDDIIENLNSYNFYFDAFNYQLSERICHVERLIKKGIRTYKKSFKAYDIAETYGIPDRDISQKYALGVYYYYIPMLKELKTRMLELLEIYDYMSEIMDPEQPWFPDCLPKQFFERYLNTKADYFRFNMEKSKYLSQKKHIMLLFDIISEQLKITEYHGSIRSKTKSK